MGLLTTEHGKAGYLADFALYTVASRQPCCSPSLPRTRGAQRSWHLRCLASWPGRSSNTCCIVRAAWHPAVQGVACRASPRPRALIGTPTILSAALIAMLVFLPALVLSDLWRACAFTFGLLTGYLVYAAVHHAAHHWRADNAWLRQVKRHHALHHSSIAAPGRYGVSSASGISSSGQTVRRRHRAHPTARRVDAVHPEPHRRIRRRMRLCVRRGHPGRNIQCRATGAARRESGGAQAVTTRPVAVRPLTARLRDNHRALLEAHRAIARSIAAGGAITPAAEWLVDNYHVVEARSARSATTCRPATTGNCRSWPTARWRVIRACSDWRGPSSRTPTAASTRACCAGS